MQTRMCEVHVQQNVERLTLERLYRSLNQRFGHPAADIEICNEMEITMDEFHRLLDRMKGLNIGHFWEMESPQRDAVGEPLIGYSPEASGTDPCLIFRKSEIRERLARAIEELPQMERLVTSLYYHDELTLKEIAIVLGIKETDIEQLRIKAMLRLRGNFSL